MPAETFQALVFWLPAFLFSATVHEAAHAWAALRLGDPTAWLHGHLSLSPWPHVRRAPLGMIVIPVVTALTQGWAVGWAVTPIDREWVDRHPRRAALVSLAGPLANLVLAGAAFALMQIGLVFGAFEPATDPSMLHLVTNAMPPDALKAGDFLVTGLSAMLSLNIVLFMFNLLPLPPLDGAAVFTLLLPANAARRWRLAVAEPGVAFLGLIAAWQMFPLFAAPVLVALVHAVAPLP